MITLFNREALLRALDTPMASGLHAILLNVVVNTPDELLDLTCVAILEMGDTEDTITQEIGFSPLIDPTDGVRFDQPGFQPYWALLREVSGWYELTHIVGTGFAYILLIDAEAQNDLSAMCERYIDTVAL